MQNLNEIKNTFDLNQTRKFLKAIKGNKFECYFKLIMAYGVSRMELVNIEWKDIDFENSTITIYPISQKRNSRAYYSWKFKKKENLGRTFPLLPNLKNLLLGLRKQQELNKLTNKNYDITNEKFICLKSDGTRLNINTLSRNLRYIARDNDLPQILLSDLANCLDSFVCQYAESYDFYRAWTRFDCKFKKNLNLYKNFSLSKNKKFLKALNNLLENATLSRKSDFEM